MSFTKQNRTKRTTIGAIFLSIPELVLCDFESSISRAEHGLFG